jgi:hypothetical protein
MLYIFPTFVSQTQKNRKMTTVLINDASIDGRKFLEYIKGNPHIAQVVNDNAPLPVPEEELVSLEEFKRYMENLAHQRLGLKLTL